MSSHGQPKRGGLPAWRLSNVLTTPHCKRKTAYHEMLHRTLSLDGFMVGSCEHCNEPLGSIKGRDFLD